MTECGHDFLEQGFSRCRPGLLGIGPENNPPQKDCSLRVAHEFCDIGDFLERRSLWVNAVKDDLENCPSRRETENDTAAGLQLRL